MTYFKALMKVEWLLTKRGMQSLITCILLPIFFFLFFSSNVDDTVSNRELVRNYLISMTAFSSLGLTFFTLPFSLKEDQVSNRLRLLRHSPVPIWVYYLSKLLRMLLFYSLAILANFAVGHFFRQVDMSAKDWILSALLLLFGELTFMPFGLLLAQLKSSESMSALGNLLYIGLAMLGGMWMPLTTLPDWIQSIGKWTPTYRFHELVTNYLESGKIVNHSFIILVSYSLVTLLILGYLLKQKEVGDR
ncbi:ABC transporter permease [Streptococcus loxodontisalivarius]|uniref:ABC-2 type transport system permease protein n=1 Tax=Streptococcus loxodontisalivarius TaxID=1349415 RepID=A0ABS2PT84_9STRE|nr:ABC transporter permease [Streptococcus loxodontisalivarius]MBM7642592.1 ABC-2 type transport system permease protein [Streptococcus loxodontisalivarius]